MVKIWIVVLVAAILLIAEFWFVKSIYEYQIQLLRERLDRGREYVSNRSKYLLEADLSLEGRFEIHVLEVNPKEPIILEFTMKDGRKEMRVYEEPGVYSFSGIALTHVKCVSGHLFRFSNEYEAGMEYQGATIFAISKTGIKTPCEVERWEKEWIIFFDRKLPHRKI